MTNQNSDSSNFIKHLLAVAPKHCDNCGSRYSETDFKIIKNNGASTVLHLKCRTCGNAYMLNVFNPQNGLIGSQRTPINIDLNSPDEIQKFAGQEPVDQNEALDLYNDLDANTTLDSLQKRLNR